MPRRVLLLGLGMQGRAVLHDLLHHDDSTVVTVADLAPGADAQVGTYPPHRVRLVRLDVTDTQGVTSLMSRADVVIEALPGPLALPMGELAAEAGVPLVSSMYYRNPREADATRRAATEQRLARVAERAAARGISILTEFGLDPGLDLIMARRALAEFERVDEFRSYGAGLPVPVHADNALRYRFSWSPVGVLRSYARPARLIREGAVLEIPAGRIFEPEHYHLLNVPALGDALECYPNGDAVHYADLLGLGGRVRESARDSGRWPGHCAIWHAMSKLGFLDPDPVDVGGARVAPLEFTALLLASQARFQYGPGDADLTFVRVDVRGLRKGMPAHVVYDLIDRRDFRTGLTSMQRTVGFTLALGARLILGGPLAGRGLLTPLDVPYDQVFPALAAHDIHVTRTELPGDRR
jgi:saccharopine dehydrogenase-like NADP-dependent oxidoreductase